MSKLKLYTVVSFFLMILYVPVNALADPMPNCSSLIGTTWKGKIFDQATGKFIKNITLRINSVSETTVNGRFPFTGSGFVSSPNYSSCAEFNNQVSNIAFGLVLNQKIVYVWNDYPDNNHLDLTSTDGITGSLSKI